jgi:hypothetical protein
MVEVGAHQRSHWLGERHETFFDNEPVKTLEIEVLEHV